MQTALTVSTIVLERSSQLPTIKVFGTPRIAEQLAGS